MLKEQLKKGGLKNLSKLQENLKLRFENNRIGGPIEKEWSPEQIVGRMALNNSQQDKLTITHETIYKYVYRRQKQRDKLYLKLRRRRKKRLKRLKTIDGRGKIPNKTMIDQRPLSIDNKERIGDWEGDTIIGKDHQGAMLTLVERKSKFTFIFPLEAKTAQEVEDKITFNLKNIAIPLYSITFDNGREFTNHEAIAKAMNCQIFFAFPYHSWERGINRNGEP